MAERRRLRLSLGPAVRFQDVAFRVMCRVRDSLNFVFAPIVLPLQWLQI